MRVISAENYRKMSKDFKCVYDGQKMILGIIEGGATGMIPVEVIKQKDIDAKLEAAFYKVGFGVQINIMNLGKINVAGEKALLAGGDYEQAIADAVKQYAEN